MSADPAAPFPSPPPTPESRRIVLGTGLTYHVLSWAAIPPAPAAPEHTVVLLHGFLDFAWGWEETVRLGLAGPYRILAPDLRGHGDSDRVGPGGYYHFFDYLADLHDLIEQTCPAGRLSLVGHSMGGSVASYYAGAFPGRVHRLALLEGMGPPNDPQEVPDRLPVWVAAWRRARGRSGAGRGYPDVAAAAARLREHDPLLGGPLSLWLAERGTRPSPDGLRFKHDPLHVTPGPLPFRVSIAEGFWRRVSCPVLLVSGAESSFRHAPEEAARRRACLPQAREVELSGAGHMMQRHQPAALGRLLREFLLEDAAG